VTVTFYYYYYCCYCYYYYYYYYMRGDKSYCCDGSQAVPSCPSGKGIQENRRRMGSGNALEE
jgi:hypothetical protein